jgi:hypothetical protein
MKNRFAIAVCAMFTLTLSASSETTQGLPDVNEALTSRADVWGELAIRQPDGPTYAFFESLLPPLRYVETRERHYPICLSAPFAPVKSRYVGNGAGINLAPGIHPERWSGYPLGARLLLGEKDDPYGQDRQSLPARRCDHRAGSVRAGRHTVRRSRRGVRSA